MNKFINADIKISWRYKAIRYNVFLPQCPASPSLPTSTAQTRLLSFARTAFAVGGRTSGIR